MSSSSLLEISAGIIQGSGIGPASYVVNSSDLTAVKPGNLLCKYADDTYLIIPSINVDTRLDEVANVDNWSRRNNLTLNRSKSQENIRPRRSRSAAAYSHQSFPCTICRSVGLSVQCIVEKRQIASGSRLAP